MASFVFEICRFKDDYQSGSKQPHYKDFVVLCKLFNQTRATQYHTSQRLALRRRPQGLGLACERAPGPHGDHWAGGWRGISIWTESTKSRVTRNLQACARRRAN